MLFYILCLTPTDLMTALVILTLFLCTQWGWLVPTVEWCVFVCNHSTRGDHWKSSFIVSPWFVRTIMENGKQFKHKNKTTVSYLATLSLVLLMDCAFLFVIRVSDSTWHVGSEWTALPPTVAIYMSQWVPPTFLDSGPGDPAAGRRPPAGSVS